MTDLSHRIETEEPSKALCEDIARALGWKKCPAFLDHGWYDPDGYKRLPPNWLTSIDAAAALMPDGWSVNLYQANGRWSVQAGQADWIAERWVTVQAEAPTEPRARTAAALRAIEAEKGNG